MLAYHTYIGSNNKEDTVFPLQVMYLTQGEDGSYSHQGILAMDFAGYGSSGVITNCPYYAPCTLELVATPDPSNHAYVYTSVGTVNFIDGTTDYFTIMVNHDNNTYTIGRRVNQGELLGHTGTYGNGSASGVSDHVHIEAKKGSWEGLVQNAYGVWGMKNSNHLYSLIGVNDTDLVVTGGYNWREFTIPPTPPTPTQRNSKFPWVLYARKLRNRNNL